MAWANLKEDLSELFGELSDRVHELQEVFEDYRSRRRARAAEYMRDKRRFDAAYRAREKQRDAERVEPRRLARQAERAVNPLPVRQAMCERLSKRTLAAVRRYRALLWSWYSIGKRLSLTEHTLRGLREQERLLCSGV